MARALPFSVLLITDAHAAAKAARGVIPTVAAALGEDPSVPGARHRAVPAVVVRDVAVMVRAKGRSERDVAALCAALLPVVRRAGARLLVHGWPRLVARLGLDGVHLPAGADPQAARIALPPRALLGASRHAGDDLAADAGFLDYVLLAPVFAPTSKPHDTRTPLGVAGLRLACGACPVPVVALGGVDSAERARACRTAGAQAVAALGGLMSAHDPSAARAALARDRSVSGARAS